MCDRESESKGEFCFFFSLFSILVRLLCALYVANTRSRYLNFYIFYARAKFMRDIWCSVVCSALVLFFVGFVSYYILLLLYALALCTHTHTDIPFSHVVQFTYYDNDALAPFQFHYDHYNLLLLLSSLRFGTSLCGTLFKGHSQQVASRAERGEWPWAELHLAWHDGILTLFRTTKKKRDEYNATRNAVEWMRCDGMYSSSSTPIAPFRIFGFLDDNKFAFLSAAHQIYQTTLTAGRTHIKQTRNDWMTLTERPNK